MTELEQREIRRMYDLEEQEQIDALKAWWRRERPAADRGGAWLPSLAAGGGERLALLQGQHRRPRPRSCTRRWRRRCAASDVKQVQGAGRPAHRQVRRHRLRPDGGAGGRQGRLRCRRPEQRSASGSQWAVEHARDEEIRAIARLRLAGVRLDEKKYDEALKSARTASTRSPSTGMYADLRGDVLLAQGKAAEAKAAYKLALEKLPAQSSYRLLVQLKARRARRREVRPAGDRSMSLLPRLTVACRSPARAGESLAALAALAGCGGSERGEALAAAHFKPTAEARVLPGGSRWAAPRRTCSSRRCVAARSYAAAYDGTVTRLDAANGKQVWRVDSGLKLSGGVGADADLVLVASDKGVVLAYSLDGQGAVAKPGEQRSAERARARPATW